MKRELKKFARAFVLFLALLPALSACTQYQKVTPAVTATEEALCGSWNGSLPTRSRKDTPRTQAEIGHAYDTHLAACEGWELPF